MKLELHLICEFQIPCKLVLVGMFSEPVTRTGRSAWYYEKEFTKWIHLHNRGKSLDSSIVFAKYFVISK